MHLRAKRLISLNNGEHKAEIFFFLSEVLLCYKSLMEIPCYCHATCHWGPHSAPETQGLNTGVEGESLLFNDHTGPGKHSKSFYLGLVNHLP